jgi:spore maturation protein CgeB
LKIILFGLSISSSWGNGHATTYRALVQALHARGHRVVFYEKDVEWYASNRDLPQPPFCDTRFYTNWRDVLPQVRRELGGADVAMVGSYFPDGIAALDAVLDSSVEVRAFYDIDTPITMATLRERGRTGYLLASQLPSLDLYFSFTGGAILGELENRFGVRRAAPLYCSFDPAQYHAHPVSRRFECAMSYMGTYAADRQPKLEQFLFGAAAKLPEERFIVAGPQYPRSTRWPKNVRRIVHLNPRWHPYLYSSSRITLNLTRRDMVMAGYSPSVRLFEAAACGATIASDNWPGLDSFFTPGREILLPVGPEDLVDYLSGIDERELRAIGLAAQARVMEAHTSQHRAAEFEREVELALHRGHRMLSNTSALR